MNTGKQLETNFVESLNCKYYNSLNSNLQNFISFIFGDFDHNQIIYCQKLKERQKADISKKSESHRQYIQIKWFSIFSDINKIRQHSN